MHSQNSAPVAPPPTPYLSRFVAEVDTCHLHASRLENLLDRALGAGPGLAVVNHAPSAAPDTFSDLERRLDALSNRLESIAQRADSLA